MKKPEAMSTSKWASLTPMGKHWWLSRIRNAGSVEAVSQEAKANRAKATPKRKLTDKKIEEIRQSADSNTVLADKYGVSPSFISKVRNNHRR